MGLDLRPERSFGSNTLDLNLTKILDADVNLGAKHGFWVRTWILDLRRHPQILEALFNPDLNILDARLGPRTHIRIHQNQVRFWIQKSAWIQSWWLDPNTIILRPRLRSRITIVVDPRRGSWIRN